MIIVKLKGGLGNQIFQYAFARNISIINDIPFKLDIETGFKNDIFKRKYRLFNYNIIENFANNEELNKLISNKYLLKLYRFTNNHFNINLSDKYIYEPVRIPGYNKKLIQKAYPKSKLQYIDGYWANPKYFNNIRKILLSEFTLKTTSLKYQELSDKIKSTNSVSIHIRRTDYIDKNLNNNVFFNLPLEYYNKAINLISSEIPNPCFYIFSDDIEWAKKNVKTHNEIIYVSSIINCDYEELNLMNLCNHNIIANSTFSWWGAWLNNNPSKKVYYPALWYNKVTIQNKFEKNGVIPPDWIRINL